LSKTDQDTARGLGQISGQHGRYPTAGAWIKVGHTNANSAPKPNNAWWRCAESGQCNSPAMIRLRTRK